MHQQDCAPVRVVVKIGVHLQQGGAAASPLLAGVGGRASVRQGAMSCVKLARMAESILSAMLWCPRSRLNLYLPQARRHS